MEFYRSFNRFAMKCFFHKALTYFGYSAKRCIIDNTNLARHHGTGKNAVIEPEMEKFARQYGFEFVCHEIGHSNRKAGEERSFYTVETNFIPGRNFESMEDINRQGIEWAKVKLANTPMSKTGLIPAKAYEHEKAYLIKLPAYIPAPYNPLERGVDQYGYAAFDGNYYWVPGKDRGDVKLLQYSDILKIYRRRELLMEYELPSCDVKNETFSPKGFPKPNHTPHDMHNRTQQEEKRLRGICEQVSTYLNFALKPAGIRRNSFIRDLFVLSRKIALPLFIKTIERALKYRILDTKTIERIAVLQICGNADTDCGIPSLDVEIDCSDDFQNRESYKEGRLTDEPDLSEYDKVFEKEEKSDK